MMSSISLEEAKRLVAERTWKHTFEVIPGVVTRGDFSYVDSAQLLDQIYGLPKDLSGLRALDIGTLDGIHSFELERRGASVTAVDIQSPDSTGFNTARRIIGSKVEYVQGSVYDLTKLFGAEEFDIVLFFGVWYHLKNPVRAFEEISCVLRAGGTLCGEGEALKDYVEVNGQPGLKSDRQLAVDMGASDVALSVYYPQRYKGDLWSWYVPNRACVSAWLETAGMKMVSSSWWHDHPHQRLHIVAKKDINIPTTVDNPVW